MMFKPKPKTADDLMKLFVDSVQNVLTEHEGKMADLDNKNDNDEVTRLHYTEEIINRFFMHRGNL